ncbi:bifunctional anthranilate synthase component I family protein/class IV aminotransferase [Paraburkholderia bonniea]|uniref:bifunctional anthranilate synthase component I family protein/class IV aminotransferase n=1 Tax=Paraburkholderia bonniea TaxID=2152891 RepID=UPI0025736FB4|nr:bifunctional anthranilate synthase component I family protein/class IV aminotransferase [Paraburkholderia bonniea]WJF89767.1 bifunctional anthranilate synthase component I family protein/class IV aminotransferase [Paraburkholderia bonniea]WJF93081.1 bifunctional anthranilate synthase component I family protein/class IV aminotransferase [Paraburkholderia bonniea]
MTVDDRHAVFALLDDCEATAAHPFSRLYTGFMHERVCADPARLNEICEALEADIRRGLHAVVLADYEWGYRLQLGLPPQPSCQLTQRGLPALRFLLFERCDKLARADVDAWLAQQDNGALTPSVAGTAGMRESVTPGEFSEAIDAIHAALSAGDAYQVNYTFRLAFEMFGAPCALYRRLRVRQPVRYGALMALPGEQWMLSCSPELFLQKQAATLSARPMKGTARRSSDPVVDQQAADFLAHDPKNRAENVMIVDLLRNDLARVADIGSVKVAGLFSLEAYASVWQMTSTVQARLRADRTFADVLRALFPCGSITGAPKHRTMQLIDALETTPRGLYAGAVGWLEAPAEGVRCGDFCLSVAIRTLTLEAPGPRGLRCGTLGVGAGIVLDSRAVDEYQECQLKASFLTDADPGFQLFETMYASREDGVRHLSRHLARLSDSARWLNFSFDEAQVRTCLDRVLANLPALTPQRLRLALGKHGGPECVAMVLSPLPQPEVNVMLAPDHGFEPMQTSDALLQHKTTRRAAYDTAWRMAEAHGAFDMLFFNERGELTEGGRSNVFVKLDGRWWTPPLRSGVLPGVMRGVLLDDAVFGAAERVLTRDEVLRAEALMLSNALRGAMPARLV